MEEREREKREREREREKRSMGKEEEEGTKAKLGCHKMGGEGGREGIGDVRGEVTAADVGMLCVCSLYMYQ